MEHGLWAAHSSTAQLRARAGSSLIYLWSPFSSHVHPVRTRRRGVYQGALVPLLSMHGATRWAATPHPPLETTVTPLLCLVTAVGVGEPKRWRLQLAIIISIVHSMGLALELELGEELRLWGRRRSARAQGFFIDIQREASSCISRASTDSRTATSPSPSA